MSGVGVRRDLVLNVTISLYISKMKISRVLTNIYCIPEKIWVPWALWRPTDGRTDGRTDRQTDEQGESSIPPLNFVSGGIIMYEYIKCKSIMSPRCVWNKKEAWWPNKLRCITKLSTYYVRSGGKKRPSVECHHISIYFKDENQPSINQHILYPREDLGTPPPPPPPILSY